MYIKNITAKDVGEYRCKIENICKIAAVSTAVYLKEDGTLGLQPDNKSLTGDETLHLIIKIVIPIVAAIIIFIVIAICRCCYKRCKKKKSRRQSQTDRIKYSQCSG
ncbi:uncharacterized protein LOC144341621 [Saccoglossus kowalevskii]